MKGNNSMNLKISPTSFTSKVQVVLSPRLHDISMTRMYFDEEKENALTQAIEKLENNGNDDIVTIYYDFQYPRMQIQEHCDPENDFCENTKSVKIWSGPCIFYKDFYNPKQMLKTYEELKSDKPKIYWQGKVGSYEDVRHGDNVVPNCIFDHII